MLHKGNRVRAFVGHDAERRARASGHFMKALIGRRASVDWCIENRIPLQKAANELGNTSGGFLVPSVLDGEIIAIRDRVGAFRQCADIRRARSDNQIRPRRTGGVVASWVSEGAPIPESNWTLDSVEVALKKLGILVRSSTELYEDSEVDVGTFVAEEIAYALAAVEDDSGFNGDGTSAYRGISGLGSKLVGAKGSVAAAAGHNTYLQIDNVDIGNVMAGILSASIPGACWFVSAICYAQCFCRLGAISGGLVSSQNPDGTISASFLGFPVVFSSKLPNISTSLATKPMLYFGNLRQAAMIVESNSGTIIATSTERLLDQGQIYVRGTRREDIVNHSTGDSANFGAMAMLVGTA